MLAAFKQHPCWHIVQPSQSQHNISSACDAEYEPSAEAAACQLVWAEYERIDWERIYAGK